MSQYAVIDIADAWPGETAAFPRTILSYSSTGGQVLALTSTRDEAIEALQEAQDCSGLQQLTIVEITYEPRHTTGAHGAPQEGDTTR